MPLRAATTEALRIAYDGGWTIERLAKKLGVSREHTGRWLNGTEKVPRRRQAQILLHLEAQGMTLFGEDGRAVPRSADR